MKPLDIQETISKAAEQKAAFIRTRIEKFGESEIEADAYYNQVIGFLAVKAMHHGFRIINAALKSSSTPLVSQNPAAAQPGDTKQ